MPYVKIPLEKQLDRASRGVYIHPEYIPLAIRAWADMPIAAYLGMEDRRKDFRELLGITEKEENAMTYQEAALGIRSWYESGLFTAQADRALFCLAEPLLKAYRKWEEQNHAKNTT